ncbi:MAG: glucoamylase family protein [Candidatus Delongbacteria bacterium]
MNTRTTTFPGPDEGRDKRRLGLGNRLRRLFHGAGESRTIGFPDLTRWAEGLYRASSTEPPLHGAVFAIEQLELHARDLAAGHVLGRSHGDDRLLRRLWDSERVIERCHLLLSRAHAAGRRMALAAEWLLDNRWLIEEQVHLARLHFPRGYSRQLPRLAGGASGGRPRIYDIILEFVAHVDGRVDEEALARYLTAYQSVTPLTLGEIWSVAIMLRLALVESLRRVTVNMSWQRAHRDSALAWAQRFDAVPDRQDSAFQVLADLVHEGPPLSTTFVAQFTQALQGRGATTTLVLAWLEQRLADQGQTIEEAIRAESQGQAAAHSSVANTISSLRLVNALEWHEFVESHSRTEHILRGEAAGVYPRMDFPTRDSYRHVVEALARRFRLDENQVARAAVELADAACARAVDDVAAHVGWLLVDEGRPQLERVLRGLPALAAVPPSRRRAGKLIAYLGLVVLLAVPALLLLAAAAGQAPRWALPVLCIGAALVASQFALAGVNWLASHLNRPQAMPRMDFEHGIPAECRTLVVVPTLLTGPGRIAAMLQGLELRYLANRDPNLWFALLTDFTDADQAGVAGDDELLDQAGAGIAELNLRYGDDAHGRFLLFHRPRLHNPQEGCWMGRERKRGKLEDFNALLCGSDRDAFCRIVGDVSQLTSIRYVITLDTDTDLPWGAGWRLVGAAAHPLNRPLLDAAGRRLLRGYAILQPRVSISWRSATQSRYARLMAGQVGFDPYTHLVSDLYQDLFQETSFIGKGLYDVGAFRRLLDGRFPDNAVLSHDLLESCYARSGQCSDVELLEDSPAGYLADLSRRHRWMRGDWQIAPWLGLRVGDAAGRRIRPDIALLGWWKIFDNLRRALVAPAYAVLLGLGWFVLPTPGAWTLAVLGLLFLPELLPGLAELVRVPPRLPLAVHVATVARAAAQRLARTALWLVFLPLEAGVALDAAARSLWRVGLSRQHLLEWQTAAAVERHAGTGLASVLGRLWAVPLLVLALAAGLGFSGFSGSALAAAAPLLLLWFGSPLLAWWISRPLPAAAARLGEADLRFLSRVARLTWRYFEVFVGPQENWLPPDNFQQEPGPRVAHRTSPTDMGLSLLANLCAHDLGYLSAGQLLERTARTLDSMEQLERHRGHFYNWYDTVTRRALRPLYVSTVDSGNLTGHVRVLRSGLLELAGAPLLPDGLQAGLRDTLEPLAGPAGAGPPLDALRDRLRACPPGLSFRREWLAGLGAEAARLVESCGVEAGPEAAWWATAFERQVRALRADLSELAPWLESGEALPGRVAPELWAALEQAENLAGLADLARQAAAGLALPPFGEPELRLARAFTLGAERIAARLEQIGALAARCLGLAGAEFAFLYDPRRKLLAIGYQVAERRLDTSVYDLLASEARLASYVAIASGQLPFDHWFALGRRLTTAHGRQVLLSWSGSMFEYLMPRLVMPHFAGTLLDQTCTGAVARQIEYGRQRGVPWGISESCYNVQDGEGTWQYRAFGVPGLGLQRGLGDEVVVAPYATLLALLVDPRRAVANLRQMAARSWLGVYGFFEAVDFTPARLDEGESEVRIQSFFAHHHGMGLLALGQALLGPLMQRRFLSIPEFHAAALLLLERVPRTGVLMYPHAREARASGRVALPAAPSALRTFTNPNTPLPDVQLLSNGRYHVMVSAAGAGYSRFGELAVTRWREDPTVEAHGVFGYVRDLQSGHGWSTTFQPTLRAGQKYEAVFSPGRAEFRRQDDQVETHTEVAVSIEDDLEIRRIRLTNRSPHERRLSLTVYAEIVLAPGAADELHRVFSNLFVQSELCPELGTVLLTRRPRSADERPPWLFCLLPLGGGDPAACSFETDRARFIGRGRSLRNPLAQESDGPLSGTAGAVLDPCAALRRELVLAPDATARFDLILGVAPTREAALRLSAKYQDHRTVDRVLDAAPTHSRTALAQLGASEADVQRYAELAAAVIFAHRSFRAPGSILRRNRKGQAGLWRFGIPGDLPIVLLRVGEADKLQLVQDLLKAHAWWRTRGLATDLVIWNEDASSYRRELGDQLLDLIAAGPEAHLLDKPGGVFVRQIESFSEEDRVLLQAVARVVIRDADGSLGGQLERWRRTREPGRALMLPPVRRAAPGPAPAPAAPRDDLLFSNGTGGFTRDGREYIIDLPPGTHTPAPWVNVLANPRLGTVVSESGSAYTWFGNAQQGRLTPWSNDPVSDPAGEVLYLRDEESGRFQSPMPWPRMGESAYACRHGFGYSVFEHAEDGLVTELKTYVAVDAPVKFLALKIRNAGRRPRTLSVFGSVDWVLGDLRSRHAPHVVTEREPLTGAILARNAYSEEFSGFVAFFDCSEPLRSVSGDRAECLGRNGDPSGPAAVRLRELSGRLGAGLDPCAAILTRVVLEPGAEREVVFILGAGSSSAEATALVQRHRGVGPAHLALEEVWRFWRSTLGVLQAETPDAGLNVLFNGWLPYQVLACRLWGRSGFSQSGGAYGFRDQLQDCLALLHQLPGVTREQLLRCAGRQFAEGDVQHWWHPPGGRGIRTRCSDDFLWLPYAVARYVAFTGDTGVLDEVVPYLASRTLGPGEESYYDLPGRSDQAGPLYEHCVRALRHGLALGAHGLPLMGGGDWNDGMNLVGQAGRGESVWLGFFLHQVLSRFIPLAEARADAGLVDECRTAAAGLARQLDLEAWDGRWYKRAWFDDGQPLGSAAGAECRIDLLPQAWATLAGVGDPGRRRLALDAVWEQLVRQDLQLVQLLDPPFDQAPLEPGYIKAYPPGVRENGGQYTHAAIWAAQAFALAGRVEQAATLVALLNPIQHTLDPAAVERYRVEPYVLAADVYSQPPHAGRGGWTWYTGAAGWYYQLLHEVVLGLERRVDTLHIQPRVPAGWTAFRVHYRYCRTLYVLEYVQDPAQQGPVRLTLDGRPLAGAGLDLQDDAREHRVEVRFGPCEGRA